MKSKQEQPKQQVLTIGSTRTRSAPRSSPVTRPVRFIKKGEMMKAEFTAIIEPAPEGGFWAICPEVPGANGQGETIEETKNNLRAAIEMILKDRKEDILRGLPDDAIQEKVYIG